MNRQELARGAAWTWCLPALGIVVSILLAGCSGAPETGPAEVRWDRDVCTRCLMTVSDRHYSAQVRGASANQKTKVSLFDDLGCAVLWLEDQPWKDDPRTEVWVNDFNTGEWIDARQARYVDGRITPMDFGLGASKDAAAATIAWDGAVEHIRNKKRPSGGHDGGSTSSEGAAAEAPVHGSTR